MELKNNISVSQLVLASSSPRRKELVANLALSLPVSILSTDADETIGPGWTPAEAVERLSLRKAWAAREMLAAQWSGAPDLAGAAAQAGIGQADAVHAPAQALHEHNSLIVAADTVVVLDGDILGKPRDDEEALAMLKRLQGRTHEVYTGIACLHAASGDASAASRRTVVRMKTSDDDRLRRYVATGEPRDKAGAYGIQGLGSTLVEGIEGCYFNVVGLPLSLLAEMLEQYGVYVI